MVSIMAIESYQIGASLVPYCNCYKRPQLVIALKVYSQCQSGPFQGDRLGSSVGISVFTRRQVQILMHSQWLKGNLLAVSLQTGTQIRAYVVHSRTCTLHTPRRFKCFICTLQWFVISQYIFCNLVFSILNIHQVCKTYIQYCIILSVLWNFA